MNIIYSKNANITEYKSKDKNWYEQAKLTIFWDYVGTDLFFLVSAES